MIWLARIRHWLFGTQFVVLEWGYGSMVRMAEPDPTGGWRCYPLPLLERYLEPRPGDEFGFEWRPLFGDAITAYWHGAEPPEVRDGE